MTNKIDKPRIIRYLEMLKEHPHLEEELDLTVLQDTIDNLKQEEIKETYCGLKNK